MMNEMKTGVYTYNEESYNFNFYTDLSVQNKAIFVRTVVDTIVDDKNYDSVLRDIIFDYTVISMMTDIDISFLKITDDDGNTVADLNLDLVEDFLLSTNIIDIVRANAFPTLFDELNKAIDNSIQYLTGIHPNPLNEALANLVNTLERKINNVDLDSMMGMAQKFMNMTGELTPENVVNAYINSETHKKNLAEVAASKKKTKK